MEVRGIIQSVGTGIQCVLVSIHSIRNGVGDWGLDLDSHYCENALICQFKIYDTLRNSLEYKRDCSTLNLNNFLIEMLILLFAHALSVSSADVEMKWSL